jgi:hypothetical protein
MFTQKKNDSMDEIFSEKRPISSYRPSTDSDSNGFMPVTLQALSTAEVK